MTNLSHLVRRFNRFELKYLAPLKQAESFKRDLRAYLLPDEHGDNGGSYGLTSLYYDSPDLRCYWEKLDGIKVRRKLRIRYYEAAGPLHPDSQVMVEIKQRTNRVTQKRRAALPYHQALALCNERRWPVEVIPNSPGGAVLDEAAALLWQFDLRPTSAVRYTRQALVGSDYDTGLRVTFDTNLTCWCTPPDLEACENGLALFPPELVVIEIKVNERVPYWLTELVAAHNLSLYRISKYCRSIDVTHPIHSQEKQAWTSFNFKT